MGSAASSSAERGGAAAAARSDSGTSSGPDTSASSRKPSSRMVVCASPCARVRSRSAFASSATTPARSHVRASAAPPQTQPAPQTGTRLPKTTLAPPSSRPHPTTRPWPLRCGCASITGVDVSSAPPQRPWRARRTHPRRGPLPCRPSVAMRFACMHATCMEKAIQVRNVPEELHRRLKIRAATEGLSLSEFLLRELRKVAERPSRSELLDRLSRRPRPDLKPSPAAMIRKERDTR